MVSFKTLGLIANLAAAASAQPHGHHHRRHAHQARDVDVEIEYVTEWVTIGGEPAAATATASILTAVNAVNAVNAVPTPIVSSSAVVTPSSSSTYASASASATGSTSSSGSGVTIVNNLAKDVYLWSTSNVGGEMQTLSANGGSYSETWQINPDGGGISIKMATETVEENVLQFEYTLESSIETIWWDMSSINLSDDSLFVSEGFKVVSDESSCTTVTCLAGDSNCSESYQQPDDVDTQSCVSTAAFTLTLG